MSKIDTISAKRKALLAQPVPRYTSYPTANHFGQPVTQDMWQAAMAQLGPDDGLSLYLHIPYCETICTYCGCTTKLLTRASRLQAYVTRLLAEIDRKAALVPAGHAVTHLHFGGGTPNLLTREQLAAIMDRLHRHFSFAETAEIAMEFDPRVLRDGQAAEFAALGVNRASLGVQSFAPDVQQAINRVQPQDMVQRAVDDLRAAGITGINFDLVYGLPLQSLDDVAQDCAITAAMGADRIAIFGYAHVPHVRPAQRKLDGLDRAGPEDRLAMAALASTYFAEAGYQPIGIDHFARPADSLAQAAQTGRLRRNFQGYTADGAGALIGFGVSSISSAPGLYAQNPVRQKQWEEMMDDNAPLTFPRGCAVTAEDTCRAELISAIMCGQTVTPHLLALQHNLPPDHFHPEMTALQEDAAIGLIDAHALNQGQITMAAGETQFTRIIASRLDTWLKPSEGRHAQAV